MSVLFNLLILSLPFGVLSRFQVANGAYLYAHDLFAGLILLFTLLQIINKRKIEVPKLFILISGFLLIGAISLILNSPNLTQEEFIVSFSYIARLAAYFSILFGIFHLKDSFKEGIIFKIILSGVLFTIFGFIQFFYYPALRNLYYLGWDEHLGRLFSTFLDPNFAGSFLVIILVLIVEKVINLKKKNETMIYSGMGALMLVAIILTHSRSAFIMLIIALSTLFLLHKKFKIVILSVLVCISLFFLTSNTSQEGLNPLRIASVEARVDSANEAISIFQKYMFLGVGFNAYRYVRIDEGVSERKSTLISNAGAGTDNSYLFVLATTGVVGFIFFAEIWINILKRIYSKIKESNPYAVATFSSLIALLVNTIFINSIFYTPILVVALILAGITLSKKQ